MSNYIRVASTNYINDNSETDKNSISEVDGEIMIYILQILSLTKSNKEVVKILQNYKKLPDNQISQQLEEYYDHISEGGVLGEEDTSAYMVNIGGSLFPINSLFLVQKSQDMVNGYKSFNISINPSESVTIKSLFCDVVIRYDLRSERDKALNKLQEELTNHNIKIISI